jgi:hypothetical protein
MVGMRDDDDLLVESGKWLLSSRFRCSKFEFSLHRYEWSGCWRGWMDELLVR